LLIILASALFQLAAPDKSWAQFVLIALMGAGLVLSLEAARVPVRIRQIVVGGVAVIIVGSAIAILGPGDVSGAIPRVLALIFVVLTPVAVILGLGHQLRDDGAVTLQSMFGGLCIYLLIAIAFSFAFGVLDNVGDPFFADGRTGSTANLLYFSFATMTTTGFGDFVAATDAGRALSVTEALVGQIYLVTVVALIVANLGRRQTG
jgi:small-conductance mechanosensitive channel